MKEVVKIAWAVDPCGSSEDIDRNVKNILERIGSLENFEIHPIHVTYTPTPYVSEYALTYPEDNTPRVARGLQNYLKEFDMPTLKDPVVLQNKSMYRRTEIQTFLSYTEENNYDLILLAAHGRKGIKRLALGSFTESIVANSNIPCLTVNTSTNKHYDLETALLPLKISEESTLLTQTFIDSKSFDFVKSLTLYHHVCSEDFAPEAWIPDYYQSSEHDHSYYQNKAIDSSRTFLEKIAKGVQSKTKIHITQSIEPYFLEEAIEKEITNQRVGLLVLPAKKQSLEFLFLSGVTKHMIRTSPVPVLMMPRCQYTNGRSQI